MPGLSPAQAFLLGYDIGAPLRTNIAAEDRRDGRIEHRLTFVSGGSSVPALWTRPSGGERATVLVQHGGGESKDDPLLRLLARRWAEAGFATFAIDAPDHGERAGVEAGLGRRAFFQYTRNRVQNAIDLRRALDCLVEAGAAGPFAYWGVSMGAGIGVMLLAAESRIEAACLCLGGARARTSWPAVAEGVAEFVAANLDPLAFAPLTTGRPVLMLNGSHDDTISVEDAVRLYDALGRPKEQRWFQTGHKVTPAMLRASRAFFEQAFPAK